MKQAQLDKLSMFLGYTLVTGALLYLTLYVLVALKRIASPYEVAAPSRNDLAGTRGSSC